MPQENSSEYKIGQFFAIFSAVQIGFGEKMKLRTEGRGTEPGQGKAINSSPATLRWRSTNRRKSVAEKGATMLRWRGRGSSENGRGLNKGMNEAFVDAVLRVVSYRNCGCKLALCIRAVFDVSSSFFCPVLFEECTKDFPQRGRQGGRRAAGATLSNCLRNSLLFRLRRNRSLKKLESKLN